MSYDKKNISAKLKKRRKKLNLTLDELSKKTGISSSTLQRYETNPDMINFKNLLLITKVLRLPIESLISSEEETSGLNIEKQLILIINSLLNDGTVIYDGDALDEKSKEIAYKKIEELMDTLDIMFLL